MCDYNSIKSCLGFSMILITLIVWPYIIIKIENIIILSRGEKLLIMSLPYFMLIILFIIGIIIIIYKMYKDGVKYTLNSYCSKIRRKNNKDIKISPITDSDII